MVIGKEMQIKKKVIGTRKQKDYHDAQKKSYNYKVGKAARASIQEPFSRVFKHNNNKGNFKLPIVLIDV